ncbi:MAG TPA: sigma-54 dependent transcriptional regulator, partial [Gemmatimonadales bacterium]|nr:sigma-54 dependent transcriptional regulator [Gemmatimonadales bacterium]
LEYDGHEVLTAGSGPEALTVAERENPDLVFLDIKMPGLDGLEVLSRLRGTNETLPVVIISAHGTAATALEAGRLGAFRFIEKPLSKDYVLDAIREGLELGSLRRENRQMRSALETRHEMVGSSSTLKQILDQVRRAAPTNATVLILGESGVGKELIARAIHRSSLRAKERFVQVNCAAIPEELIESELFGHERGAFTGATEKQTGKFEQADRGTIFLDEVGDMSPKTQAKVLRVLQEGEVERLGSARTIKVDVRVIAATNKDLEEEIAEGRFREDLYFRLSVIPISVPPLRERLDDIPSLVQHFVGQFSRENNRRQARFAPGALDTLRQARWRGNIRELRNVVERLLIMSDREVIEPEDVRSVVRPDARPTGVAAQVTGATAAKPATLREFKEWSERAFLVEKLREFGWNISKTAEVIDTPRSNLYKKLEQYGIKQEGET